MKKGSAMGIRTERRALWAARAFGAAGLAAACMDPAGVSLAYRLAVFCWLSPAVGCLILLLIHRVTGGQWASGVAPFLRAGAALLPWIWLFSFPLLLLPPSLGGSPSLAHPGLAYDGRVMVAARACAIAAVFFGLSRLVSDGAGSGRDPMRNARPWVGPVGLIVLFFMLTILADDWLESLEPGWHSTAFPVVWMAGGVVFGLALALLGGLWTGAAPASDGRADRPLGLDWGNLLLTTMVFWCYVSFAQFLIIWAGNLPEETTWFLRREVGAWEYLIPAVALFGFAIPFFLLLSRRLKVSARGLAAVAILLAASQVVYTAWVILPAGGSASVPGVLLALCFLAAAAGVFLNRFAGAARRLREEVR
jgi:hypothetical protein